MKFSAAILGFPLIFLAFFTRIVKEGLVLATRLQSKSKEIKGKAKENQGLEPKTSITFKTQVFMTQNRFLRTVNYFSQQYVANAACSPCATADGCTCNCYCDCEAAGRKVFCCRQVCEQNTCPSPRTTNFIRSLLPPAILHHSTVQVSESFCVSISATMLRESKLEAGRIVLQCRPWILVFKFQHP